MRRALQEPARKRGRLQRAGGRRPAPSCKLVAVRPPVPPQVFISHPGAWRRARSGLLVQLCAKWRHGQRQPPGSGSGSLMGPVWQPRAPVGPRWRSVPHWLALLALAAALPSAANADGLLAGGWAPGTSPAAPGCRLFETEPPARRLLRSRGFANAWTALGPAGEPDAAGSRHIRAPRCRPGAAHAAAGRVSRGCPLQTSFSL